VGHVKNVVTEERKTLPNMNN